MSEVESKVPQLRFPEFNVGWSEYRLGSITDVVDSLHTTPKDYVSSGFPMIRVVDVNNIELDLNKCLNVSEETYRQFTKKYQPKVGDVVLSRVGTCGASIMLRTKDNVCLGQNTVLLHPKINKDFYHTLVKSNIFQVQVSRRVVGSTQKTLSLKDLKLFKLNIPTKPEQQKIAAFLTEVDNKIEQLSKKQELLGEYKKGLMQKIFSQAIRFKADDGSEFPDWEETKLGDVSDCLDNRRQPLNGAERNQMKGDIPYYGANGIVDYVNDYIFDEELVLLAEDGGNFNDFSSKPIAQKISGKAWVNNHAHILRAKSIITTDFLFYSLVHKDIRRYIVGGSRVKLNKSDLLSIKTILPPLEEQTKIAAFLTEVDNKIEQVSEQLDKSKQFKKALLQQMFV